MSALISIPLRSKGKYSIALDERDYADTCDCGFVVMWPGRTNELLPKGVNPGISSCAKAYFIMDKKTGEMCFYFLSMLWDITCEK